MKIVKGIGTVVCTLMVFSGLILAMCEPAGIQNFIGAGMFILGLAPWMIKSALGCCDQIEGNK